MKKICEIVNDWLTLNGYDGLCHPDNECACAVGDLMPCDEPMADCAAGHRKTAPAESGYDFFIIPE